MQGRANASVNAGYGYVGILVAFLARQNPRCARGLAAARWTDGQRRHAATRAKSAGRGGAGPEGMLFLVILWSETLYGRWSERRLRAS